MRASPSKRAHVDLIVVCNILSIAAMYHFDLRLIAAARRIQNDEVPA